MKKTICLNMIVKDESHIINDLLESVYKHIDYYVINDTGSTDDTKEKIKNFFDDKGIKGEIIDHNFRTCECHNLDDEGKSYKRFNWFHFGWNRQYALEKAYGKSDYILFMDADDVIIGDLNLNNLEYDQYLLHLKLNQTSLYRTQIIKNDENLLWKWNGGLHEFISSPNSKISILTGDYYINARILGNRSKNPNKYDDDAQICLELLEEEPNNTRLLYYTAQSFKDAFKFEQAIQWYSKCLEVCNDEPEKSTYTIYNCIYNIGKCMFYLKRNKDEIISIYELCHNFNPKKLEPIYEIFQTCLIYDDFVTPFKYIDKALSINYPINDLISIDKSIYDYKMIFEVAVCYYNNGYLREALYLWYSILYDGKCDDEKYIEYAKYNIEECIEKYNPKEKLCFYIRCTEETLKIDNFIIKSAETFIDKYDVIIFGDNVSTNIKNGIFYCSSNYFKQFKNLC